MSSRFMHSLTDENPDLKKQIGCMNGLFQLFNCHHFYGGRRHIAGPNHNRLPSGQNGKRGTKAKVDSDKIKGNYLKKAGKEKQRISFESSRTSFSSSSCSSSFSPAECSKESHIDRPTSNHTAIRSTPTKDIYGYQSNAFLPSSQNSLDLRNVVKDSINRETGGLSIRTATKVEAGQHKTLKYIDSPRPFQSPKPSTTRNTSINESTHCVVKVKEVPKMSNECEYGSRTFAPMDAHRFSYDGRGTRDAHKLKPNDLPRLSLDSRKSSIKGSKGQTSVVAKLMGVETLLNPMLTDGNQSRRLKTGHDLNGDPLSPSSRMNENKRSLISGCSRNSGTELRSPRMTNAESKKPVAARCPVEPAPWRQLDGNKGALKCRETPVKASNSFLAVYGEIEKRLAELEFMKSGKEFGACKQTLEAMQKSKQMSETQQGEEASGFMSNANSIKGTGSPTCRKSRIEIIKPTKVTENSCISTSTAVASRLHISSRVDTINEKVDRISYKDLTPRPNTPRDPSTRLHSRDKNTASTLRLHHILKEPSPTARENPKMAMSSETTSLKLHQKKPEMEKQSLPLDQSRSRRQSSSLQAESGLSHRKLRHKSHNLLQSDDQLSDISSDMRDSSHQGDDHSIQSESNMSMASNGDTEVTSTQSYGKIQCTFSPKQEKKQNNPAARLSEGNSETEPPRTPLEQPSPVSVLDATFYGDESPSPVKKRSNAFEGKAENTQNLLHKFMNLDSTNEWPIINKIEHISNSPNPDHEYIAEVMSASGLLSELDFMTYYQLHPSGHLINPNLFHSLENIKASIRYPKRKHSPIEKNHRKLIFDVVNEILIMKSVKKGSYKQWILPSSPEDRIRKRCLLVRDLCSEIDELQTTANREDNNNLNSMLWGDFTLELMDWTEYRREIPWLVLDVERLIFKDLICEVISSQTAANPQQQRRRHCRRLISK